MTKRFRRVLFILCALLLLISGVAAVFYSQGYRFDFERRKITKTGGFYFKVFPRPAEIFISGQLKKKTDFFFGAAYVENLLPKKYDIEIKKQGYFPWKKNLEIREKQVAEAKNIVLIPQNPKFDIAAPKISGFFPLQDEKKIILKTEENQSWQLSVYDTKNRSQNYLIGNKDFSPQKSDFVDLKFSNDSKRAILKLSQSGKPRFFLIELEKSPVVPISIESLGIELSGIFFNPENDQKLFLFKNNEILEMDLNKKTISSALKNIAAFSVFDKNIYYLENSGFIFKTDLSLVGKEKINEELFPIKKDAFYEIYNFEETLILKENEALYLLNLEEKKFEKFFDNNKGIKISPDFKKLVYFSDSEIWVLFLKEQTEQPPKKALEKMFLTRFSEKTGDVFWFTSHYLIFNSGAAIKIAEIDDRDNINIVDFANFPNSQIFWSGQEKELYILSGENLYISEKLAK